MGIKQIVSSFGENAVKKPLLIAVVVMFMSLFGAASFSQNAHAVCPATGTAGDTSKSQDASLCYDKDGNVIPNTTSGTTATNNNGTTNQGQGANGTDNVTTCAVEKIGWFICPVMEQAAKISDKAFQLLADNFLRTDPELVSNQSGTKTAWEVSRNIANIMFIIAFLAVIVSQVTGMGINNYGLKKMIPRLLVGAIAVNVSYYLCQLAVDLTNIFGYEIEEAMSQISNSIGPSVFGSASQLGAANYGNSFGNVMTTIIVAALAVTGIVWLIMGPMIAVVAMVLVTALSIIVILLLRKALIVLLIVASPIAFVMYLLPNTEGLFTKWRKAFTSLLFVFPVVGVLFGAGQLASTIIIVSGATSQQQAEKAKGCEPDNSKDKQNFNSGQGGYSKPGSYDSCGMGSIVITGTKNNTASSTCKDGHGSDCHLAVNWLLGLTAMLVAVAPLIAVWSVLKGALAAAGSIGGKVTATISKGGGGVMKRAEAADTARQNRMALRSMQDQAFSNPLYRRRARRDAIRGGVERELKNEQQSFIAKEARDPDSNLANKMAGGTAFRSADTEALERVRNAAVGAARSEQSEAVKIASELAKDMKDVELEATLTGDFDVNDPKVAAAINELGARQNFQQLERVMNRIASNGPSLANRTLSQTLSQNAGGMFSGGQLAQISSGSFQGSYMDTVSQNFADGMAPEKLAGFNSSLTGEVSRVIKTGAQSQDAATRQLAQKAAVSMSESAGKLVADQILNKKVSGAILSKMQGFENGRF